MKLEPLLAGLAVLVWAAQARDAPPPITWEQATALPPDQLADRVLRQLGAQVTAVTRPGAAPSLLRELTLATAPHATATVGLCAATRLEIGFEAPGPPPPSGNGPATPVRARLLRTTDVYKAVGEIEPYAEVSEARAAEEDRRCAEAGPVIPVRPDDRDRPFFFAFEGAADPVMALLALQRAIADARAGTYRNVGCTGDAADCRNAAARLGGLSLADLAALRIVPSGSGGNRHLIRARFLMPAETGPARRWALSLEVEIGRDPEGPETIDRLGRAEIARWSVDDQGP